MTTFRMVSIDDLDIFYREVGSRDNPAILLFALEEEGDAIAVHIRRFMTTHVA